jgi:hypothetical protein
MATKPDPSDFERLASEGRRPGLVGEFWEFLRQNKKWWLLPIIVVVLAMGALLFVASSGVAPFLYTIF